MPELEATKEELDSSPSLYPDPLSIFLNEDDSSGSSLTLRNEPLVSKETKGKKRPRVCEQPKQKQQKIIEKEVIKKSKENEVTPKMKLSIKPEPTQIPELEDIKKEEIQSESSPSPYSSPFSVFLGDDGSPDLRFI